MMLDGSYTVSGLTSLEKVLQFKMSGGFLELFLSFTFSSSTLLLQSVSNAFEDFSTASGSIKGNFPYKPTKLSRYYFVSSPSVASFGIVGV
jgi:hypothetical protein